MPKLDEQEMSDEVRKLMKANLPTVNITRIEPRAGVDSDGDPSLFIKVVMKKRPPRDQFSKTSDVVDQFRTWLITDKDDERFPSFRFLDEDDERELAAITD